MTTPLIQTSFAAGEIAPALYGHVDLAKFHVAATTFRNAFVNYRGGAYSRAGTKYVIISKTTTPAGIPPRIVTFQFSISQGYLLEIGFNYMAFYLNGSPITETPKPISGATQTSLCALTVVGHGWTTGDRISVVGIVGMGQLNNRLFIVLVVDANTVSLFMLNNEPVDASGFTPYIAGGTAARLYEIPTPWSLVDVPLLKFAQSADVMSITHPSYPQYDLVRIAGNDWTLTQTGFGASQAAPGQPIAAASNQPNPGLSPPTQPAAYAYVVTAVSANGAESVASPVANITNAVDMAVTAGSNAVQWPSVAGAKYYNIYRAPTSYNTLPTNTSQALPVPPGAIFSFVGQSFGTQFVDSNTIPDTTQVPPRHNNPFAPGQIFGLTVAAPGSGYTIASVVITTATGSGAVIDAIIVSGQVVGYIVENGGQNYAAIDFVTITGDGAGAAATVTIGPESGTYPGVVAYYQQRRVYAATNNQPDTYFMSRPGEFTNFDSGIPVQADDAITGTPWGQQVNAIQWILAEPGGMMVMTGGGAWQVTGSGGSALNPVAITPASQQAVPQLFSGISPSVGPIQIYSDILFVTAQENSVRDITYNYFSNNWSGSDQTVLSSHLFLGYDISQWTWCEEPYKIVWTVRCDGVLLSYTFLKEQEVFGWARHDTQGAFLSVTSVSEPPVDALYTVVQRNTPAGQFYFIERMDNRIWLTSEDPWCVDAGVPSIMPEFDVPLVASSVTGAVAFQASRPVFAAAMVGRVLRIAGGIALLDAFIDSQHMSGTWSLSPSAVAERVI